MRIVICCNHRRRKTMRGVKRIMGKIEKGIPIPPVRAGNNSFKRNAEVIHRIQAMKPGDSFTVKVGKGQSSYGSAYTAAAQLKVKVTQRLVAKDTVRVWRTK